MTTATETKPKSQEVVIKAPNFKTAEFHLVGTAPLVLHRFSVKAQQMIRDTQAAGSVAKSKKNRSPKDFEQLYKDAQYISDKGWHGIPAAAFRKAAISACRTVGFKMTLAKLSLFIEADGEDKFDGTPLVRILKGTPEQKQDYVRLETGVIDIRVRPMWRKWEVKLTVRWDADQFTLHDVSNLLMRVGMQVGIGEGRPDSKDSAGMGWGLFNLKGSGGEK